MKIDVNNDLKNIIKIKIKIKNDIRVRKYEKNLVFNLQRKNCSSFWHHFGRHLKIVKNYKMNMYLDYENTIKIWSHIHLCFQLKVILKLVLSNLATVKVKRELRTTGRTDTPSSGTVFPFRNWPIFLSKPQDLMKIWKQSKHENIKSKKIGKIQIFNRNYPEFWSSDKKVASFDRKIYLVQKSVCVRPEKNKKFRTSVRLSEALFWTAELTSKKFSDKRTRKFFFPAMSVWQNGRTKSTISAVHSCLINTFTCNVLHTKVAQNETLFFFSSIRAFSCVEN